MTDIIHIQNIENKIIHIEDIKKYIQENNNEVLILTPKENYITKNYITKNYITEKHLIMTNIKGSKIKECIIKNKETIIINSNDTSYSSIVHDIWKSMPIEKMLENTTFNIKDTNETEKGYHWCPNINKSYQGKDAEA